ncbi:MAG: excinuclease ABC subunit UvrC [Candidatus Dormibacteria bacterium]
MSEAAPGPISERPELLRARLRALPAAPGVYLMRGAREQVLYVGKAANLRDRVRSYFVSGAAGERAMLSTLLPMVTDFEHVACASEKEALVLENNLIKEHQPPFNIRLRDDKNYLYVRVPLSEALARPTLVRRPGTDDARYFGPYTDAKAIRGTLKSLRRVFPHRACSEAVFGRHRVCLDYHLKLCPGPCEGLSGEQEHTEALESVSRFLEGRSGELEADLRQRMQAASDLMQFEVAATQRDRLRGIQRLREQQRMVDRGGADEDLVAVARGEREAHVRLFQVRGGKLVGADSHNLAGAGDASDADIVRSFVGQYYARASHIPKAVLVPVEPTGRALLEQWLGERRGTRVQVRVPQRGERRHLLDQLQETARQGLRQLEISRDFDSDRAQSLLHDLARELGLPRPPTRIECYDISNIQGTSAVGSMVVFLEGRPEPSHYRHFRIQSVEGSDDFAMLREVLGRRFTRLGQVRPQESRRRRTEVLPDVSFDSVPDLVLIDGGRGQLSAALAAMTESGVHLPTFGLAKKREELFRPGSSRPVMLERGSEALFLVQRIRDEAHRFAITHHRKVRAARSLQSGLEQVEGVGPVLRRALMRHFGSLGAIREATPEQLCEVPRVNRALALRIKETL